MKSIAPVAYFSAEYGFEELPMYAGGLGVLATDYIKEASAQNFPLVATGLFYHYGFAGAGVPQTTEKFKPADVGWQLLKQDQTALVLKVPIFEEEISFQIWHTERGSVRVYLLDCDIAANSDKARKITAYLYDQDFTTLLQQNALLGLGGHALLEALQIRPSLYHLNEGHTCLVALAGLAAHKRQKPHATTQELAEAVRLEVVSSKHTVLSGAGMYIEKERFITWIGRYCQQTNLAAAEIFELAEDPVRRGMFTTTRFMLSMSRYANAVSRLHAQYEKKLHPDSTFDLLSITNGIHPPRWQHPSIANVADPARFWAAHNELRQELINYVNNRCSSALDPNILTVVWARRIAPYKRPTELFADIGRLSAIIARAEQPVQFIIAGKPNPIDDRAVEMTRQIGEHALDPRFGGRIVYLREYNLAVAHHLVQGADLWLNTPERGYEASGTSGMKAAINGVLQCSVSDGWVDEIDLPTIGWELPDVDTAAHFYDYLEHEIAPQFYDHDKNGLPAAWIAKMQAAKKLIEKQFCANRMLEEYQAKLYHLAD